MLDTRTSSVNHKVEFPVLKVVQGPQGGDKFVGQQVQSFPDPLPEGGKGMEDIADIDKNQLLHDEMK